MTTPEVDGVVMVPDPMFGGEPAQAQVIADQEWRGLRYNPTDLGTLNNVQPTPEIKGFFQEHMEFDQITDAVMTACEMLVRRETDE